MSVQWAHLGGELLVASGRGAWIQQPELGSPAFLWPMPDSLPSTAATTRQLLDGAIAAAERAARPAAPQPMSALWWAWQLVNQWYSAHHSIALLPRVAERFSEDGRQALAEFTRQKLADEQGHDSFAVADLQALGYEASALVRAVPPDPAIAAAVEYARRTVEGQRPAEFLGYVYAIERRVIRIPEQWFTELERMLPAGVDATSGLRSHATSLDIDHVQEAVEFVAGLPSEDRLAIAEGCYRITRIRCDGLSNTQPREEDLAAWFAPFARSPRLPQGEGA